MGARIEADACVVGAGYAGLTAAYRLHQAGRTVVVLEARDRIGGRVWTTTAADGAATVDRGGGWLAPYHDVALALAGELGVTTYKTWVAGKHLLVDGERIRRYTGLIPKISPLAVLSIARAQLKVDRLSKQVPVDAPWDAPSAAAWDARTIGDFVRRSGIRSRVGHDLFEMAVRGCFTGDLDECSFLHLLWLTRAHGSLEHLFSIEGGAQENLVAGGAGSMAARMAAALGDAVQLGAPVSAIRQAEDRVTVEAPGTTVVARQVVVTTPPALALEIAFDPALRADRLELYRAAVAGPETKTLVLYERPFWRDLGYSGQTAGPGSVSEVTLDASPVDGAPGVLASFTFGPVAERFDGLDTGERRRLLLDALTARLGPEAARPVDVVETPWWKEPWTRGCSMAHLPPGVLSRLGPLLQQPFGRVHWAGTETATTSHGAIDGAIRSGERAAAELLAAWG